MRRLIKWIVSRIKALFKKKESKRLTFEDILPDFKDKFKFGLYAHTAWYSFKSKSIPYQQVKDMGIDFIYEQYLNIECIVASLKRAKKSGLKILINGYYNVGSVSIDTLKERLQKAFDIPDGIPDGYKDVLMGVLAYDEPHLESKDESDKSSLSWIKENIIDKFRSSGITGKCFINCLPNYARQSQITTGDYIVSEDYIDEQGYANYVNECAKLSDIVCGDFYGPLTGKKEHLWETYLKILHQVSKDQNKPIWQFVSCTKQGEALAPTKELLRHRIIINALYGAQAVLFFKMLDYNSTDSPWTDSAEKSPTYDMMKELLNDENFLFSLSLFVGADITNVENTKSLYTVSLTKNGHSYKVYYALVDTTVNINNVVTKEGISKVSKNTNFILTKNTLTISLVE